MADDRQILETRIRQLLQDVEAPYAGRPGEVYLDRAWHRGAAYMVEQVLAALDEIDEEPEQPAASPESAARFDRLRSLLARIIDPKK